MTAIGGIGAGVLSVLLPTLAHAQVPTGEPLVPMNPRARYRKFNPLSPMVRFDKGRKPSLPAAQGAPRQEFGPDDIAEFRAQRKLYPNTEANTRAHLEALGQRDLVPGAIAGGAKAGGQGSNKVVMARTNILNTQLTWVPRGPYNLQPPYVQTQGPLPLAGRVNAIALHPIYDGRTNASINPNDVRKAVMYIATANGGVWRATINMPLVQSGGGFVAPRLAANPGAIPANLLQDSIVPLSDFSFPVLQTSAVAIDPLNPRIIYVGTGDFDGGTGTGVGIMKSSNDGRTWVNVGNSQPNVFPPQPTTTPIMEGTSVSAILVHPDRPNIVVATSGRSGSFLFPGNLWRSTDQGSNWTKGQTLGTPDPVTGVRPLIDLPPGDWSSLDISARRTDRTRTFYAARHGDGIYRSDDDGATWLRLPVPTVFNRPGSTAGGVGLEVAASKVPASADSVYVVDASANQNAGIILKSLDRGQTWVDITGSFPRASGGGGNFNLANYNLVLSAFGVPVNVVNPNTGVLTPSIRESLAGGAVTLANSLGIGVRVSSALSPLTGLFPNFVTDPGVGPDWVDINIDFDWETHRDQHALISGPLLPNEGLINLFAANDGGVYGLNYLAGAIGQDFVTPNDRFNYDYYNDFNAQPPGITLESGAYSVTSNGSTGYLDINSNLVAHPLFTADFFLTASNEVRALAGSWNLGAPTFAANRPQQWQSIQAVQSDIPDAPLGGPSMTYPNAPTFPLIVGNYTGAMAFDEGDTTGNTQYASLLGTQNWEANGNPKRIFRTTNNWQTGLDITPDRALWNGFEFIRNSSGAAPIFIFNRIDPSGDSEAANNWRGEPKDALGVLHTFNRRLYTGTSYVYRYDPPGTFPAGAYFPPGTDPAMRPIGPSRDRGVWRRYPQQISQGGSLTALQRLGDVLFTGSSQGEIWACTRPDQVVAGVMPPAFPGFNGPWVQIAGGGTTSGLPNRPITTVAANPTVGGNPPFGDIVVSLAGAPGVPRVWRNQNAFAPGGGTFIAVNGQGTSTLPDVPVNSLVRDPDDINNTWYAATDLGVYVTTDGGSTWNNATAPLGLPNVECTAIKIIARNGQKFLMVATFGRGVWQFDLTNPVETIQSPNVTYTATVVRTGGTTAAPNYALNLTLKNSDTAGPAFNVRLTDVSIQVGTQTVQSTRTAAGPVTVGTLGRGQTQVINLPFPAGPPLRPGATVVLRVQGIYTQPPIPPGVDRPLIGNNNVSLRTRLP